MTASRLSRLPRWISHWLGYRPETPKPLPTWQIALWSFIASFCGLSVVQGVFHYSEYFTSRNVPGIVASYVSENRSLSHLYNIPVRSQTLTKTTPGCVRRPCLRRNRSTPRPTTRSSLRPLLQRPNRHLHHKAVQPNARPNTLRITPLACSFTVNSPRNRRHAVDRHHTPASRCDGPPPGCR